MCAIWSPPPPRRGYPVTPRKKRTPRKAATADTRKVSSNLPASRLRMKNGRVRGFSIGSEATYEYVVLVGIGFVSPLRMRDLRDRKRNNKAIRGPGVKAA